MQWTVFKCFYLFVGCLQFLLANSLFIIIILFGFRCALLLYFLIVVVTFIFFCRVLINCITKLSIYCKRNLFRLTKSRKINKIVKMSKRKAQIVSFIIGTQPEKKNAKSFKNCVSHSNRFPLATRMFP